MRKIKDSGIEWIGAIPNDWNICKFKNSVNIYNGNSIKDENKMNYDDPCDAIPYIATKDIALESHTIDYNNGMYTKKEDKAFKVAPQHSILLCIEGGSAGRKIGFVNQDVSFINKLCCFYSKSMDNKYLFYFMQSSAFTEEFKLSLSGMIGGVSVNELKEFPLLIPNFGEQQLISNYLDKKCAELDAIITSKEKTNALLKERRQSIIYEAVTKGLDPTVSMKDSGFEWIGTIPSTWKIRKLRYLGSCSNGISKAGEFFGSGSPFVSYGDVYKNMELPREVSGLIETTAEEQQLYSVEEGDVFFTRTSETIEEVAISSTCMQTIENATFAGFLIRFRPNTELLTKEFSKYYFRSEMHRFFFVKEMNLVTRASLSQDLLKKLPVLLPPVEEQKRIASYLDNECSNIDELIATNESTIEKLKEYRQSVIYEAVTGKVEI